MGETVPKGLDRRGFIQLAAMGIEMTGSRNASAAPESETMAVVTRQPEPDFNDDENTANILIETLITWGATHVFGVVGDGINGITEALRVESC